MKAAVLSSVLLLAPGAVLASGGHGSLLEYRRLHNGHHARHAAMAQAASSPSSERRFRYIRKSSLQPRKTAIGAGDSVTEPDNLAKGSATKSDGCTVWHTASAGEVCLGLIDKTPGWSVEDFYKYNPAVNSDCSNLTTGLAYCVTVQADGPKAQPEVATGGGKTLVDTKTSPTADAPAEDDEEDCEDDEEEETAEDDDEDCEDEEEGTAIAVSVKTTDTKKTTEVAAAPKAKPQESTQNTTPTPETPAAAPAPAPEEKKQEAPKEEKPAPQPEVKPTSTYVEPPKETPTEPKPSPPSGGNSGAKVWEGQGTFYYQNSNAGSCGNYNPDSAMIVAIKQDIYASGVKCGDKVHLTNTATGAQADAVVADLCPTCVGSGHGSGIDLSTGLFQALAGGGDWQSKGVLPLKYTFSS